MRKTMVQILGDVAELHSLEERMYVLSIIQQTPTYPISRLIDAVNQELIRLYMPYTIEDLAHNGDEPLWIVREDVNPKKLNYEEPMHQSDRSVAIYNMLLEPFKDANMLYPKTLADMASLLNIDFTDDWKVSSVRDWLISLNVGMYPHECKGAIQKLIKMSVHYTEN